MDQTETTKEIALGVSKAIMNGNWDKVNELLSDDFYYEGDGNPRINKEEYIVFMKNILCGAFSNMEMDFKHVVAEGDLVAINYTNDMTHIGEWFGIPASGKRIQATGQFIRKVKDGKVVAEWQTTNMMGLMNAIK